MNNPASSCRLRTRATAEDAATAADLVVNGTIAPGTVYPVIQFDVDLGTCGAEPLTFGAGPVQTVYSAPSGPGTSFAFAFDGERAGPFCNPACMNGGACNLGTCDCTNTGFSGPTCATPICAPNEDFIGGQCIPRPTDTTPPDAPVITSHTTPFTSKLASFELSGTCEPGATVSSSGPSAGLVASTPCDPTLGTFTLSLSSASDGTFALAIRQTDAALNTSAPTPFAWTLDTLAPAAPAITNPAGTPHHTGNDLVPVSGTCEPSATVLVSGDSSESIPCNAGTFAFDIVVLENGTFTFVLTQVDAAGNTSATTTLEVVRDDTVPPSPLVLDPDTTPFISNTSPLTLTGSCDDGQEVLLQGADTQTMTCAGGFSFTLTAPSDDTRQYQLRQRNPLTGLTSPATPFTWTYDTSAPSAPTLTAPADNPTTTGGDTLTIAGSCEAGATVTLSGAANDQAPCSDNTFSFSLSQTTNGTYTFDLTQTDLAGNTSTATTLEWTRDDTEPAPPMLTSPDSPHHSKTSLVTLTGTCLDAHEVHLSGPSTASVPCTSNTFSFQLAADTDQSRTWFVHQTRLDTGIESARVAFTWVRDTVAPEPLSLTEPSSNPFTSGDDLITVAGACEDGATVELLGAETDSAPCTASTFSFLLAQGVDGTHAYTLRQVDLAQNVSATLDFTWHRDTTIPETPLVSQPASSPFRSNADELVISGSCEPDHTVELSGADTQSVLCVANAFSFTVLADEGAHAYDILQRNPNNGFASATTTLLWERDTTAPDSPIVTSPSASPHYTGGLTLTLAGTCDTDTTVHLDGADSDATTCSAGTFSFALTAASNGTRDYTLTAEDDVGNVSTQTPFQWIVDTTIPATPTFTSPLSSPHFSATSSLVLSGTCTDQHLVYLQGASTQATTCSGGSFAFTVTADTDDTYTFSAFQESHLTGLVSNSAPFTWVRDTTRPDEVTVTSPPYNPYFSGDDTLTIAGTCESGTTVTMSSAANATTPCTNGQYSFQVTRTVNATSNFNLVQTDRAGNPSLTLLFQWVRDNTIPASAAITSPSSPHYSNTDGVSLEGTCSTGFLVTLSGASNQTQTCVGGIFAFNVGATTDGSRDYFIRQTSLSGIDSSQVSLTWIRDTLAPTTPTLTTPSTNPYTSGDTTFALQGTCEVGATVTLAGAQSGSLTCTSGTFRFDLTSAIDGTFDYTVLQRDRTLNTSGTLSFRWVRNATIPSTPVLSSPSPNPYTSNGSSITVAGSCTGSNTVHLTGSHTAQTTCAGGAFSFTVNKSSDATYTFQVHQVSALNGFSSSSVTATWTRDTVAPAAPTLSALSPLSPSSNLNPKATGTVATGTQTIQLFRSTNCSGGVVSSGTVANFTGSGVAIAALPQQTMSVSARALDLAGNASPCSATSLTYTHRAPQLIKDINLSGNGASSPSQFAQVGTKLFFRASNGVVGNELFVSDGTANGTSMILDINPADSSNPANFIAFQGLAFFQADDGERGAELWKSNGTANGTVLVKDINDGPIGSSPANFLVVGSTLYFTADDGETGVELWKTDGTTNGTVLVADLEPGVLGSSPTQLKTVNGVAVFRATTLAQGIELWRSAGTAATTTCFDINLDTLNSSPNYLVNMGSHVYFSATEAATGNELWRTDGTTVTRLTDLYAGTTSSGPAYLTPIGSKLFMYARQYSTSIPLTNVGYELFTWTEAGGAVLVKDIFTGGTANGSPTYITALDSTRVVFRASTATSGQEPWVSDGTAAGTFQLAEVNPGVTNSGMSAPVVVNGRAYFAGTTNGEVELWATDGTTAGTVRYDVNPGPNGSTPSSLAVFNNKLVVSIHTIDTGREPFLVDASGPQLLADLNLIPDSSPASFVQFGNHLYFASDDGVNGRELWRSDGTTAGTVMVADINPGPDHSSPTGFAVLGSTLFFRADDGEHGLELWKTDGTTTTLVADICPDEGPSTPNYLVAMGSQLIFSADDCGANGLELWQATQSGPATLLKNIHTTNITGSTPVLMTLMGGKVYFRATHPTYGAELWVTDSTEVGTVLVKKVRSGSTSSSPSNLTVVGGNKLFFTAADSSSSGTELYVSDGTTAGTVLVADIYPGLTNSSPGNLRDLNGTLVFAATSPTTGRELYTSTGAGNAVLVKDIRTGLANSNPSSPLVIGNKVYFNAFDEAGGAELWVSDGTSANTIRLADIRSGPGSSNPSNLWSIDTNTLFFVANDGVNGSETWRSGLTGATTWLTQDINLLGPGWGGAALVINGTVFFAANDGVNGVELWKY